MTPERMEEITAQLTEVLVYWKDVKALREVIAEVRAAWAERDEAIEARDISEA